MVAYKAPVDEYMFILHEVLRIQDFTHVPGFENVSEELTRQIVEGAATFCEEVLQPLNQVGDEQGCVLENGVVRTPDGFAAAYQQYCDAGWNKLAAPEEHGGAGLPGVVALPVSEFSVSAKRRVGALFRPDERCSRHARPIGRHVDAGARQAADDRREVDRHHVSDRTALRH